MTADTPTSYHDSSTVHATRSRKFWRAELDQFDSATESEKIAFHDALIVASQRRDKESEKPDTGNVAQLVKYIRDNIVGDDEVFQSPFGLRRLVYCDYTASGRALSFIEQYIHSQVLPLYANTHTTNTITGMQSTMFRHEARQLIMDATNCGKRDRLVFCGNGATAALNKLVHMFAGDTTDEERRIIVLAGPFEHHSNLLPWRECRQVERVVNIREDPQTGQVDLQHLEDELRRYAHLSQGRDGEKAKKTILVGAFSAASNITGILADVDKISILMHRYGGYVVWDYATAAPYVKIDMNPVIEGHDRELAYKDAVVLSPHKFVGGVETPGVLIAKKHMFVNKVPENPGGGTVFFVTDRDHRYLKKQYEREEGGTPSIVGAIRTGLVFQLKSAVGEDNIERIERDFITRAIDALSKNPNIVILGNKDAPRLAILSFLIRHGDRYLHSNYVTAVLNDLFGIQTRSGCMCAGPLSLRLLGIDYNMAKQFESELLADDDYEFIRPGFTRLNFHYSMDETTFQYVLDAINFVATEGWRLLPQYTFYPETAEFVHMLNRKFPARRWLHNISYRNGKMEFRQPVGQRVSTKKFKNYMEEAHVIIKDVLSNPALIVPQQEHMLRDQTEALRWFIYPSEALRELQGKPVSFSRPCAINPVSYTLQEARNLESEESGAVQGYFPNSEVPDSPQFLDGSSEVDSGNVDIVSSSSGGSTEDVDNDTGSTDSDNPFADFTAFAEDSGDNDETKSSPQDREVSSKPKKESSLWINQRFISHKKIMYPTIKAIKDFGMLKDGDRVLLGLSGGKDSLAMLHVLRAIQRRKIVNFELGACTVDPMTDSYNPEPLKLYLAELGVPYYFESQSVIEDAMVCQTKSICSWCSRMKRGILYNTARRHGYNVLCLAQHLDDLAESFIMSVFHNGLLRTQKACYQNDVGDVRVIRPFVYVRERDIKQFAYDNKLPIITDNCPACFTAPTERARIKTLLANQEHLYPTLFYSILCSIKPLMDRDVSNANGEHRKFKSKFKKGVATSRAVSGSEFDDDDDDGDSDDDVLG